MNYTPNFRSILCLILFFNSLATNLSAIDFRNGTLEEIEAQAAHEGKLYFVSFTAKWCAPCKIMAEYTYPDPTLSEYTQSNYLASKIDIQSFDGVGYKAKHNVVSLPTILVFNSQGIEVGRFEKSMTATQLLEGLQRYDSPENRIKKIKYVVPELPKKVVVQQQKQAADSGQNNKFLEKMPIGFGVQVGVFGSYKNAENLSIQFSLKFEEQLNIYETQLADKKVYRLVAGNFEHKNQAKNFKGMLDSMGIDGMVKNFSGLN